MNTLKFSLSCTPTSFATEVMYTYLIVSVKNASLKSLTTQIHTVALNLSVLTQGSLSRSPGAPPSPKTFGDSPKPSSTSQAYRLQDVDRAVPDLNPLHCPFHLV